MLSTVVLTSKVQVLKTECPDVQSHSMRTVSCKVKHLASCKMTWVQSQGYAVVPFFGYITPLKTLQWKFKIKKLT
jgi:hypothetical protein